MRRDLTGMAARSFDVIVVGGGIYGACTAWEAALLGLEVALIEAGDFGHGTSSNSLRTLHGGLRHLQRLDFVRMRESIRERREWLRLAPELSRPMRFVLPLGRGLTRAPGVMRMALWANDVISWDRNRGVQPSCRLGAGAIVTPEVFQSEFQGLALAAPAGAAAWYDAVCLNTERLQLATVQAAVAAGAQAANYVRAMRLLVDASAVCGVRARDELTGEELELHAGAVINAAGPWVDEWAGAVSGQRLDRRFHASKAFNLLTRALPFREALGLSVPPRDRTQASEGPSTYFIIPWNGYSLIGTRHLRCEHGLRQPRITAEEVNDFLADLNGVLGKHRLTATDVKGVFAGLLPEEPDNVEPHVALERAPQVIDHTEEGVRGLVSIVGVKWTTARAVGERAAKLVAGYMPRAARTATAAQVRPAAAGTEVAAVARGRIAPVRRRTLNATPTPESHAVAALLRDDPTLAARVVPDLPVTLAQVLLATREEMSMRLSDIVRRRTPLYLSEALDRSALHGCASVMARELRWSAREIETQIDEVEAELEAFRGPLGAARRRRYGNRQPWDNEHPDRPLRSDGSENLGRVIHASAK